MATNITHKYWFFVSYETPSCREWFYISVPIKDYDALHLVGRVHSALRACFIHAYVIGFPAVKAYADVRRGIPVRPFSFALDLWHEILPLYYTKDALDIIFDGF